MQKSCGGTLIAPQVVLTAAHCATEKMSDLRVCFVHNGVICKNAPTTLVREVSDVRILSGYETNNDAYWPNYDMALLKLKKSAPTWTIPMPISRQFDDLEDLSTAWVAGYGDEYYLRDNNKNFESEAGFGPLRIAEVGVMGSRSKTLLN